MFLIGRVIAQLKMKAYVVVSSLMAICGLILGVNADATLGNIIISKGYINKLCSDNCRQSTVIFCSEFTRCCYDAKGRI